jgi:serine/threonine protein kinase
VFQGQIGFPIKYFSGEWNGWNLLIMQLLGSSVEATRHMYEGGIMPLPVLHHVAQQGLARLRTMHLAGFVHRDVKPENFVFAATSDAYTCFGGGTGASVGVGHGHGGSVSSDGTWPLRASTSASAAPGPVDPKLLPLLHIIDFGFAKRVIDPATGQHIPKLTNQKFIGTPRFASVRAHEGILQSRRDDIEALGYMLVYLAKGRLPWQSGGAKTTYRPRQHGPAGARKYMDHGRPLDSIAEYAREDGGEAGARDRYRAANVPAHAPVEQQARGRVKVAESHAAPVVTAAAPASHITTADIRRQSMRKMFGAARAPGIPHAALTREEQRSKTKSSLARPTQPLPRGRTSKSRTERLRRHIYMKKRELSLHELCAGLPSCFMLMIDHARRLPFDAMPDYAYLDDLWSGRVV